jgi:hypothetical protein
LRSALRRLMIATSTLKKFSGNALKSLGSIGQAARFSRVLPRLLELSESSNEHLRWCCVNNLTSFAPDRLDGQHAITKALMRLMHDPSPLPRDWATFQLGTQTTADGIAIRNAFVERTTDDDQVTQYEALRALVAADIDVDLLEEALESCRPEGHARRQHQLESFAMAAEAAGLPYRFTSDIVEYVGQPSL